MPLEGLAPNKKGEKVLFSDRKTWEYKTQEKLSMTAFSTFEQQAKLLHNFLRLVLQIKIKQFSCQRIKSKAHTN